MSERRILATPALSYANGPIHIGHPAEYIQTDIWVCLQRMRGHETYYVDADDIYGTSVTLRAEKEDLTPRQLIERVWTEHRCNSDNLLVSSDNYYSTDPDENKGLRQSVYLKLKGAGLIDVREAE